MIKEDRKKVVYLGPTIRGIVKNGTVFEGELPKRVRDTIEQAPIMKTLIVPLEEIVKVSQKIRQKGTMESIVFEEIKKF